MHVRLIVAVKYFLVFDLTLLTTNKLRRLRYWYDFCVNNGFDVEACNINHKYKSSRSEIFNQYAAEIIKTMW